MVRGCVAVFLAAVLIACGVRESPTRATALLEAHGIEPYLVGNLLFIAHWDEDGGRWLVYDVAGDFTPDQLTPPAGVAVPDDAEIGVLDKLEKGKLYDFHTRSNQIVNIIEEERGDWPFDAGANFIEWWRGSDEPARGTHRHPCHIGESRPFSPCHIGEGVRLRALHPLWRQVGSV